MRKSKITFQDIVEILKTDTELSIFELMHKLRCSNSVIYSRLVEKGYKGLIPLREAIEDGEI